MNKYKTIFAFAIALLSLIYTAGVWAESIGLVEEKETGAIDWAKGTVQAKGISAPIKKTPANHQPTARRHYPKQKMTPGASFWKL